MEIIYIYIVDFEHPIHHMAEEFQPISKVLL